MFGICGTVEVMDGNSKGWQQIDSALSFRYWETKLRASISFWASVHGQPQAVFPLLCSDTQRAAHLLTFATAIELQPWEAEWGKTLLKMIPFVAENSAKNWAKAVYEPFVLLLRQRFDGSELPSNITNRRLGPYADVFKNWSNPTGLSQAISDLCNHHCEHTVDLVRGDEFDVSPFDLYPVEILAIYKIRERLGLETPKIDHPLLSTPLASLAPRRITPIDDPIIRRVEKLYHDFFDGSQ